MELYLSFFVSKEMPESFGDSLKRVAESHTYRVNAYKKCDKVKIVFEK